MKTQIIAISISAVLTITGACLAQSADGDAIPEQPSLDASLNADETEISELPADYWTKCDSCSEIADCENCGQRRGLFKRLRSRFQPSEGCFDCFISPITNPFYAEDPRALTEIRPVILNHVVPGAFGGGTINVYTVQARARIRENVSLIVLKNGFFDSNSPLLTDGWADLSGGLKLHLLRDPANQRLLSAGGLYEAPTGAAGALQGLGSGNFNFFVSSARRFRNRWNYMCCSGLRLPVNGETGSTSTYCTHHVSRPMTDRFFVLSELNWFRYINSGLGGIPGIEGVDLANLGSSGVDGNNILTLAFGGKLKTAGNNEVGAAYEIPVSGRRDIFGPRVTAHWAIRY